MLTDPAARKWVYIGNQVVGVVLLILAALGVVTEATSAQVENLVGGVVMLLVGELARRNINVPRPATISADGVQVITEALAPYAAPTANITGTPGNLELRIGVPASTDSGAVTSGEKLDKVVREELARQGIPADDTRIEHERFRLFGR